MEYAINSNQTVEHFTEYPVELVRSDDQKKEFFTGYAVMFFDGTPKTEYKLPSGAYERVHRDAFDEVISRGDNVELRLEHNKMYTLADTDSGTLSLTKDKIGWKFRAEFDPEDPDHVKAKAKLRKNYIRGCSFQAKGQERRFREGGRFIHQVAKIESIEDISMVKTPAYKTTVCNLTRSEQSGYDETHKRILRAYELNNLTPEGKPRPPEGDTDKK